MLDLLTKKFDKSKFIQDIFGWTLFDDGFMEMVVDLNTSKYFDHNHVFEAIQFAEDTTSKGRQVYFGPGIRFKDQGNVRSKIENIFGSHCIWVDIDPPDKTLSSEIMKQESEKLLENFLKKLEPYKLEPSYIVSSGNGFHVYFYFQKLLWTDSQPWIGMQNAIVELAKGDVQAKDATRLLRLPGTLNLKDITDPKPVEIVGGTGHRCRLGNFKQLVQDFPQRTVVNTVPADSKPLGVIPHCIQHLLNPDNKPQKGYRHLVRRVVATFFFHEGVSQEDVAKKLMHTGGNPKKVQTDVRGVYKILERDPGRYSVGCKDGSSLKSLVDKGVTTCDESKCQFGKPGSKKAEKEEKKIFSAWFPGLVDLVLDKNGEVAYLVIENGNLVLKKEFQTAAGTLVPPPKNKVIWLIPRYTEVLRYFNSDNDIKLFEDLVEHFRGISELPTENHYKLNALWTMHTYQFDKSSYSPIQWFYAIAGRGKSRTGMGMIHTAWRGVQVITVAEAHIIRLATDLRASIFFDCTDLGKKIQKAGTEDVFLYRYEQGAKIARVLYPEKGPFDDTEYYEIYGPTIIATNEPVSSILETRSIQTIMPESNRMFNNDVKAIDGFPFRERLVAYRARHMEDDLPVIAKPAIGRLGDIMRPLLQVLKQISGETQWFFEILADFERNLKENISESREAQIVRIIYELRNQVRNERLSNETILDVVNHDRPERYYMTAKSLGWITKSLDFKKYSDGKQRGIYWDEILVAMLCGRYGIEYKQDTGPLTI
jgi:hypothetical protein